MAGSTTLFGPRLTLSPTALSTSLQISTMDPRLEFADVTINIYVADVTEKIAYIEMRRSKSAFAAFFFPRGFGTTPPTAAGRRSLPPFAWSKGRGRASPVTMEVMRSTAACKEDAFAKAVAGRCSTGPPTTVALCGAVTPFVACVAPCACKRTAADNSVESPVIDEEAAMAENVRVALAGAGHFSRSFSVVIKTFDTYDARSTDRRAKSPFTVLGKCRSTSSVDASGRGSGSISAFR